MAFGHRIRKFQHRILQASALGSVRLVRALLRSREFESLVGKEQRRESRKRKRDSDSQNHSRETRHRYEEDRSASKSQSETRLGIDRKRKAVEESDDENTNARRFDSKRQRMDSAGNEEKEILKSSKAENEDLEEDAPQDSSTSECDNSSSDAYSSREKRKMHRRHRESGEFVDEITQRHFQYKRPAAAATLRSVLNGRDARGFTALHHACQMGSEKLTEFLVAKGASVHARDSKGNTPLHIAARLGPDSVIVTLRHANADVEAVNDEGVAPSDILRKKAAAAKRAKLWKDEQNWYDHLAEELSDDDGGRWWGTEWGEEAEQQPDWDVPLERKAESRQGNGVYDEPFNLRDYLKTPQGKTQSDQQQRKPKRKGKGSDRRTASEEKDIGPKVKDSVGSQNYSQRWKRFSESYDLCLPYASVPFPVEEGNDGTLAEVLLQGISSSLHKAILRKEMLKWHPDKFLRQWGSRLKGPDYDRIVARVNRISEAIHQLYKSSASIV